MRDGKIEAKIEETTTNELNRGGNPIPILYQKDTPNKVSKTIVNYLMDRGYCIPLDIIGWAMIWKGSKDRLADNRRIVISIEENGEVKKNG